MTRFDADTPTERRKLFADAVLAHRKRGSAFLTAEAEPLESEDEDEAAGDGEGESVVTPPWVQFSEKTFNLDVTDEELGRLKDLVDEYPECRIDQLESPEESEGTNARVTARSDANRLSSFFDRVFQDVYGRDEDYRAWVVRI